MVQLGFFFHMKLAMGAPSLMVTRPLIFAISFMLMFSVVIALFKDIPDVKGDAQVSNHISCSSCRKIAKLPYHKVSTQVMMRQQSLPWHSQTGLFAGKMVPGECSWLRVQEGVRTFSVRVGVKNVFWTCIMLLEIAYAGAIGVGLVSQVIPPIPSGPIRIKHPPVYKVAACRVIFTSIRVGRILC